MLTPLQYNVLLQQSGINLGIDGEAWRRAMIYLLDHGFAEAKATTHRMTYPPTRKGRDYLSAVKATVE